MNFTTTGKSKISSVKCCILFDAKYGTIKHIHRVVTIEGATETPDNAVEDRTIHLARQLGIDTSAMKVLHVEDDQLIPDGKYFVDVNKRTLTLQPKTI